MNYGTTSTTGPIVSSCTGSHPNLAIFRKYNADASVIEWTKCYAGSWPDTGYYYMFERNGGNRVLAATANYGQRWVIQKEDPTGGVLWSVSYGASGSQILDGMLPTADGGYILAGHSYSSDGDVGLHYGDPLKADMWLLKVDSNGIKIWSKVYGGTEEDQIAGIVEGPGESFYIAGTTESTNIDCTGSMGGGRDIYVARLDKDGNMLWHRDIGGSGGDATHNVIANGKGGIIMAGTTGSTDGDVTTPTALGCGIWMMQVDSNHVINWNNCYGSVVNYDASVLCKATNGDLWLGGVSTNSGGYVETGYGRDDAYIMHTDSIGNFINAKVMGSSLWDRVEMIYPLPGDKIIAGGFCDTMGGIFASADATISTPYSANAFLAIFGPGTSGINNPSAMDAGTSIYPNPGHTTLNIASDQLITSLAITNLLGQVVDKQEFKASTIQQDISKLAPGMYFLNINNTITRKFIKE